MKKTLLSMLLLLLFVAGAKAQIDIPLTFEAIREGTVTLEKVGNFTPNSGVQYRIGETGDWSSYSYGTGISLQAGEKVQFRSTSNDAYAAGDNQYSHFTCTADCYLYGDLCSLFDYNTSQLPSYACTKMFYGNTHIKNRIGNSLVMPATSLATGCYKEMFSGCTALTTAPALPATSLAAKCYYGMFSGCTALTSAPVLPATSLDDDCYRGMFSGCTALTTAPALPATSLDYYCYQEMFSHCTALTTAPALPATSLAEECYSSMFSSCTNLATAPILPATTLASKCYSNMFSECGSLTVAPELPATELYSYCYNGMFNYCTNLTTAPALPATTLADHCYYGMFDMCSSLTAAPELPATTLAEYCYMRMFNYCTNLTTAPALPATTLAEYCYMRMFNYCTNLTTAPALPATTLANNCYRDMFIGCIHLTTAPWLPATTLVNNCYYQMFSGCSKLNYVVCLATNISASNCVKNWLSNVAGTGTFVKASNMTSWPSGNSGIPSGWSVININQFTTDGNWNVPGNWSNNAVPEAGNSVVISANATIPIGYTANVDYIIVDEGKTLTIADGGQLIHNNAGVVATVQKNITGRNNGGGWNFIASPVATVAPSAANGLLSGDYDLYYYHEGTHIWRNYKGSTDENHADPGFNLINGKGYLYANTGATTLSFTGALGTQGMVALDFNTDEGAVLPGWNLVGNPFPCNVTSDLPYYLIDGSTNQLNGTPYQAGTTIPSCTGIMVKADESGQSVTFTKMTAQQSNNLPSGLQIALSQVVEAPESKQPLRVILCLQRQTKERQR